MSIDASRKVATLNPHPRSSYGATNELPSPPRNISKGHQRNISEWTANSSNYEPPEEGIRQVTYDDRNHLSVLFQMHGSVWPQVLPFVIFNVILSVVLYYAKKGGIDLTFDPSGHKIMAVMVSFLVVSRSKIQYDRFMEARKHLSVLFSSCRELIHHMAVLSMDDMSDGAKTWRQNVAYRTILLLRVTIACLEYQSNRTIPWENEMMSEEEQEDLKASIMCDTDEANAGSPDSPTIGPERAQKWAHGKRSMSDEAFRAPIVLAYNLRREIMVQRKGGLLQKRFRHVNEELKMLDNTSSYIKAFHELRKLVTTPFPFPLVQMARTFLFFWIFTLPFALCHGDSDLVDLTMMIFVTTYGFVGLEYVSMELDDPFGDDPNDFDDLGMAHMVFEDIYITLFKLDGEESAYILRKRINRRMHKGGALSNFQSDYGEVLGLQGVRSWKEDGEVEQSTFHDTFGSHGSMESLKDCEIDHIHDNLHLGPM